MKIIADMLGKLQYEEVYSYLQVLFPSSQTWSDSLAESEHNNDNMDGIKGIKNLLRTIAALCFTLKEESNAENGLLEIGGNVNARSDSSKIRSRFSGSHGMPDPPITRYY